MTRRKGGAGETEERFLEPRLVEGRRAAVRSTEEHSRETLSRNGRPCWDTSTTEETGLAAGTRVKLR